MKGDKLYCWDNSSKEPHFPFFFLRNTTSVKRLNERDIVKKREQTGKRGEESSLKVCCVSQHIAAHTVCEKASREINNSRRRNKKSSQKLVSVTVGR